MRYRLAIFDFDGTLADSFPLVMTMMNDVADRFGFRRVGEGELDELRLCGAREITPIHPFVIRARVSETEARSTTSSARNYRRRSVHRRPRQSVPALACFPGASLWAWCPRSWSRRR